jgi:hypothetical protein
MCKECHVFLIDSLPTIKFTPSIEHIINKKRWERHSAELAIYCIDFSNIVTKIEYQTHYDNIIDIFKKIMPENKNLQQGILTEESYFNLLINIDKVLNDTNESYKSLKDVILNVITERQYIKENGIKISTEIIWLYCVDYYMKLYNEIHLANPKHI